MRVYVEVKYTLSRFALLTQKPINMSHALTLNMLDVILYTCIHTHLYIIFYIISYIIFLKNGYIVSSSHNAHYTLMCARVRHALACVERMMTKIQILVHLCITTMIHISSDRLLFSAMNSGHTQGLFTSDTCNNHNIPGLITAIQALRLTRL